MYVVFIAKMVSLSFRDHNILNFTLKRLNIFVIYVEKALELYLFFSINWLSPAHICYKKKRVGNVEHVFRSQGMVGFICTQTYTLNVFVNSWIYDQKWCQRYVICTSIIHVYGCTRHLNLHLLSSMIIL